MKQPVLFASLLLTLVAVAHLLRLVYQLPLTVGTTSIPMWVSGVAVIVTGGLAVWLWKAQDS